MGNFEKRLAKLTNLRQRSEEERILEKAKKEKEKRVDIFEKQLPNL